MLVGDLLHDGKDRFQLVDMQRRGVDGVGQRGLLSALLLVGVVENIQKLRIFGEHSLVEPASNRGAVNLQRRNGGFDNLDASLV